MSGLGGPMVPGTSPMVSRGLQARGSMLAGREAAPPVSTVADAPGATLSRFSTGPTLSAACSTSQYLGVSSMEAFTTARAGGSLSGQVMPLPQGVEAAVQVLALDFPTRQQLAAASPSLALTRKNWEASPTLRRSHWCCSNCQALVIREHDTCDSCGTQHHRSSASRHRRRRWRRLRRMRRSQVTDVLSLLPMDVSRFALKEWQHFQAQTDTQSLSCNVRVQSWNRQRARRWSRSGLTVQWSLLMAG